MSEQEQKREEILYRAVINAAMFGGALLAIAFLQGIYNLVEALRHTLMTGWNDHAMSHLKHSLPLLMFLLFPEWLKAPYLLWKRRQENNNE